MSNSFSERLKETRLFVGMSQVDFANFIDVPVPSYRKYESGDREPPLSDIQKIVGKTELKPHALWLITGEKDHTHQQEKNPNKSAFEESEGFEKAFVNETVKSMEMFAYLDWIEINSEKIDLEACGKLLFKEVSPIIEKHYPQVQDKKVI